MQVKFSAPVDTVYAMLTDPKFLEERSLELGELSAKCSARKLASGHVVKMKREVERDLPAFLAKLFSTVQTIEIEERWSDEGDDGRVASYRLEVIGQPVEVTAEIALRPSGKGCVYEIEHRAKARIPLIGGQIERFVLGQTEAGCKAELDYLADALKSAKPAKTRAETAPAKTEAPKKKPAGKKASK